MPYNTYPYELPPLPYPYDALEPYIDSATMHYHHDKHFASYVNNLNAALSPYPKLQQLSLEQLLTRQVFPSRDVGVSIMHNAGGVYNHRLFFNSLAPASNQAKHKPPAQLCAMINQKYGSYENFKKDFSAAAMKVFGSGYACLVLTPRKKLEIITLANQNTAARLGLKPLLLLDVWEHAYYLKYKNERAGYVESAWNVLSYLI